MSHVVESYQMGSVAVFIKFLVKVVVTWGVIVKIRDMIKESMFISIILYIIESGRTKRKIIKWFKEL